MKMPKFNFSFRSRSKSLTDAAVGYYARRGWMGKALIISALVHLGFLGIAATVVTAKALIKPKVTFAAPPPPVRPRLEPQKLQLRARARDLQKSSSRPRLQPRMAVARPADIALPEIKKLPQASTAKLSRDMASFGVSGFGHGIGGGTGTGIGGGGMGAGDLPKIIAGRCDPNERVKRLLSKGGKPKCEQAVTTALFWLQQRQNPDGSWGEQHLTAMTGLATLCFLGRCETPGSAHFGASVINALKWLKQQGASRNGRLTSAGGNAYPYEHAIGTYALAEAYTMTQDPELAPVIQKAADIIIKGQSSDGGWEYGYDEKGIDMSVTGWQMQALKAVHLTKLQVDGLDACMDRAMVAIKAMRHADSGHWRYKMDNKAVHPSLTGAGVLSLVIWKNEHSDEARDGLRAILKKQDQKFTDKDTHLYSWYYNTQACFQRGGIPWGSWNRIFQDELLKHQKPDGSWPPEGSGQTEKQGKSDAAIYRTALCTLMLEVFYRYLPTGS